MTTSNPSPAGIAIDGAKVRKARMLRGHNLKDFAPQCGISFTYLSQLERGDRRTVSPRTFVAICNALDINEGNREELIRPEVAA